MQANCKGLNCLRNCRGLDEKTTQLAPGAIAVGLLAGVSRSLPRPRLAGRGALGGCARRVAAGIRVQVRFGRRWCLGPHLDEPAGRWAGDACGAMAEVLPARLVPYYY